MKRYDADAIIHYIAVAKELAESLIGAVCLVAGIIGVWFIGCALA